MLPLRWNSRMTSAVRRQHVGELTRQAEAPADRPRYDRVVPGQHDAVADTDGVQAVNDNPALWPDLVRIGHESGEIAVHRDVNARIALSIESCRGRFSRADTDVALPHEPFVSSTRLPRRSASRHEN
jgi:hypothetical protein